jgi:hypothetical protein
MRVLLVPLRPLARPDVLVYWTPERAATGLTDKTILLGAFASGQALLLPSAPLSSKGSLLLYSLADQKIVGQSSEIEF